MLDGRKRVLYVGSDSERLRELVQIYTNKEIITTDIDKFDVLFPVLARKGLETVVFDEIPNSFRFFYSSKNRKLDIPFITYTEAQKLSEERKELYELMEVA